MLHKNSVTHLTSTKSDSSAFHIDSHSPDDFSVHKMLELIHTICMCQLILVGAYFFFLIFFQHLFIFGTERDRAWTGEGQRERETQNRKQAPGSEPSSAQSPTRGSNSRNARSWPGWSRTLNRLRHPGAPYCSILWGGKRFLEVKNPLDVSRATFMGCDLCRVTGPHIQKDHACFDFLLPLS